MKKRDEILSLAIAVVLAMTAGTCAFSTDADYELPRDTFFFKSSFRVRTADAGTPRYSKIKISLSYAHGKPELTGELGSRRIQMRHIVTLILGGKKKSDLDSPREQLELRWEIRESINSILREGNIEEVLFLEFVVN